MTNRITHTHILEGESREILRCFRYLSLSVLAAARLKLATLHQSGQLDNG